ncbi:MAG TPA: ABC transporter ATP-binding protein [Thermoanaerobaculia bacterium]|nr:ABC transporter ATP-binding protein [Thermoanaerobaculia bacterium]
MSSNVVIDCSGLGKRYRIGERERYRTLRDTIARATTRLLRRGEPHSEPPTVWALKDVSFQMRQGEVLGIIGRNGAGKSTLLKILSRITRPTSGRALIRGRVGSLLEVGTGFHSELTGRENIFLNGAILGMRRSEIVRRFDEIVAFAEIDEFLDTPVKRYSSGMYMRLAFAVAAHLDPEILIVDEVLAVGDAVFQKKCLGKMDEASQHGRTVLFVSHNMMAVESLCKSAIWLDHGSIHEAGPARDIVHKYLRSAQSPQVQKTWDPDDTAPGDMNVRLRRVAVRRADEGTDLITVRTPLAVEVHYAVLRPGQDLAVNLFAYNEEGVLIFSSDVRVGRLHPGKYCSTCHIPGDLLNAGTVSISVSITRDDAFALVEVQEAVAVDVEDSTHGRGTWYDRWPGVVRPILNWETEADRHGTSAVAAR